MPNNKKEIKRRPNTLLPQLQESFKVVSISNSNGVLFLRKNELKMSNCGFNNHLCLYNKSLKETEKHK